MIHCSKGLMMRKNQILKHEISHAVAGWRQFYGNKKLEENSFNLEIIQLLKKEERGEIF